MKNLKQIILSVSVCVIIFITGCDVSGVLGFDAPPEIPKAATNGEIRIITVNEPETETSPSVTSAYSEQEEESAQDNSQEVVSDGEIRSITLSNGNISYNGIGISVTDNTVTITDGGSFVISGTLSDGEITVDTDKEVRLILNGVNITNPAAPAIRFVNTGNAVIEIADGTTNSFSDIKVKKKDKDEFFNEDAVIYSDFDFTVTGNGSLHIEGKERGGIYSGGNVNVYSGTLNISAKNQGIYALNNFTAHGGTFNIEKSYEGIECDGELIINDANMQINSKDDALNGEKNIVINGGEIYAESKGDGFDSNGDMTINGGNIFIFAANKDYCGLDISDGDVYGKFFINGGTVVAASGKEGKIPVDSSSKQGYSWIRAVKSPTADKTVTVTSESGARIIDFVTPKKFELLFVSTNALALGENALNLSF